jgi:hypothetical protein
MQRRHHQLNSFLYDTAILKTFGADSTDTVPRNNNSVSLLLNICEEESTVMEFVQFKIIHTKEISHNAVCACVNLLQ